MRFGNRSVFGVAGDLRCRDVVSVWRAPSDICFYMDRVDSVSCAVVSVQGIFACVREVHMSGRLIFCRVQNKAFLIPIQFK